MKSRLTSLLMLFSIKFERYSPVDISLSFHNHFKPFMFFFRMTLIRYFIQLNWNYFHFLHDETNGRIARYCIIFIRNLQKRWHSILALIVSCYQHVPISIIWMYGYHLILIQMNAVHNLIKLPMWEFRILSFR